MADVPDVNPTKPIWPTRRDERNPDRERSGRDDDGEQSGKDRDKDKGKRRKGGRGGHIDEYA